MHFPPGLGIINACCSGRSAVRLACLHGVQEVPGSNPGALGDWLKPHSFAVLDIEADLLNPYELKE